MGCALRVLLAALLLAAAVVSQQEPAVSGPARDRAFGMLRSEAGEAWAGATVVLFARPIPDDETVGVADRVEAITDERGRFRAEILAGLAYSAWAWRDGEDGGYRSSDVVEGIVPRRPVLLTGSDVVRRQHRIPLEIADGVDGSLTARVRVRTRNVLVVDLPIAEDRTVTLPPLPPKQATVEVFDADGVRLASVVVNPALPVSPRLPVPARVPLSVLVRDIDTERGPEAAFVALKQGTSLVRLGDLAADGCGTVDVPGQGPFELVGYGAGLAGALFQSKPEPPRRGGDVWPVLREGFEPARHAHIGPGSTVRGRVLLGPGLPAAGVWIAVAEHGMHYSERSNRSLVPLRRSVRVGADGRFELRHLLEEFPPSISLVLAPEHIAELPGAWRVGLGPVIPALVDLGAERGGGDGAVREMGDIDLRTFVPLRFSIRTPDGVPAIGASLQLLGPRRSAISTRLPLQWTADQKGGVSVLLPRRRALGVVVRGQGGAVDLFMLSTGVGGPAARPVDIPIAMREPLYITGRIVDQRGAPLEGFAIRVGPSGRVLMPGGPEDKRQFGAVEIEPGIDPRYSQDVVRGVLASAAGMRTDADGRFSVPVPRTPMRYTIHYASERTTVAVDGVDRPEPLELEVRR